MPVFIVGALRQNAADIATGRKDVTYSFLDEWSCDLSRGHFKTDDKYEQRRAKAMIGLNVADVMTKRVVSILHDASIDEAFDLLLRHNISGLPVLDDDSRVIGVISEHDLMGILDDPETSVDRVGSYTTMPLISIRADAPLHEALELFLSNSMRRMPVVDEDQKLAGVISRRDVIRAIRDVRIRVARAMAARQKKAGACS